MSFFWDKDDGLLTRLLIASSVGAVLGFGTCGISAIVGAVGSKYLGFLAAFGAGIFFLSVAVLALSLATATVLAIVRLFRS
jgi:hypothetical protein